MSKSKAAGALSTGQGAESEPGDDRNSDAVARRFPYLYAYMITSFTFLFILVAILAPVFLPKELPERSWRVIDTVLGFLLGVGLSAILQFFYGSSQGSRSKDVQLSTLAGQARSGLLELVGPGAGSGRRQGNGEETGEGQGGAVSGAGQGGATSPDAAPTALSSLDVVPSALSPLDAIPSALSRAEGGNGDGSRT